MRSMTSREIARSAADGFLARRAELVHEIEDTTTARRAALYACDRIISRSWLDAAVAEGLTDLEIDFFRAPVL